MIRIITSEVTRCHSWGHQKKKWEDMMEQDLKSPRLKIKIRAILTCGEEGPMC